MKKTTLSSGERPPPRVLPFRSVANFRDLGGYPTGEGKRVRWGVLYRSGHLAKLRAADRQHFTALRIHTVIDLRSEHEQARNLSRLPAGHDIRMLSLPILDMAHINFREEIKKRIEVLRNNEPRTEIENRGVILVDDGIATGSTMIASIEMCKNQNAEKIVVGTPVTGYSTKQRVEKLVDDFVVLEMPDNFRAVAQVYDNWYDVSYDEAAAILEDWKEENNK